jgi:signal transduction histidine kinase
MKIRTQFFITIFLFVIILLVIGLSLLLTNQVLEELEYEQNIAGDVQEKVDYLAQASYTYFLFQNETQLMDWESNITVIVQDLGNITPINVEQSELINDVRDDIQRVEDAFSTFASYLQEVPRDQTVRADPEFQSVWIDLSSEIQKLSSGTAQLSQSLRDQTDQTQQMNVFLIVIILAAFLGYTFINYLITYRRTLKAIVTLQEGIKVISSGNLDYSVKTEQKDEIGALSNSLNDMTISLKDLTAKLQEHERMVAIGQTAGMVGHDLRNPLQSITGEIYLIQTELDNMLEGPIKAEMKESVDNIAEQVSYMNKIVSDLQTFVRPIEAHKQITNLKELLHSTLGQIAIPKNIQTNVQIEEMKVNTDPQLLKRVLINLINNSIQAMPNGGELSIKAYFFNQKEFEVIVADSGEGIPDDIKPKIFTPLFTTKSSGQGFGLAVCKRVIEAQGGTISFESKTGKGTLFTIRLPS